MNLAPIVLFAYNRPLHVKQTLESLSTNFLAAESDLYIYIDGPKSDSSAEQLQKIKEVKSVIREKQWCKSVTIFESETNKGLAESVIQGVTKIVNEYGKIIVLEDDLVTGPYFLTFMNDALNLYASVEEVACITGYIYPGKDKLPETFFLKGADCWGWATWKDQWDIFELNGELLLNQLEHKGLVKEFDFNGTYEFTQMLRDQIAGKNSSWAVRWYASSFLKNRLCLYSGQSLVQNIGNEGSGTHSSDVSTTWDVTLFDKKINVLPIKIEEDKVAKNSISNYFLTEKQLSGLQ